MLLRLMLVFKMGELLMKRHRKKDLFSHNRLVIFPELEPSCHIFIAFMHDC